MKFFYLLILTLFINAAQAQTSNVYQEDLIGLRKILQTTPSYKDQIKGEKLVAYNLLFEKLLSDTLQNAFNYRHFYNLAQLFFPIRDNHLSFYQINNLATQDNFPRFTGNIDSLKANLATRPLDSIAGIYHYDTAYTVALFKKQKRICGRCGRKKTKQLHNRANCNLPLPIFTQLFQGNICASKI